MARIGGSKNDPQYDEDSFVQFYPRSLYPRNLTRQPSQHKKKQIGYVVHAHCWVLLNYVIDTTLVEENFKKFVLAARKHWRGFEMWEDYRNIDRGFLVKRLICAQTFDYGYNITPNPLNVPEVQKAIDRARKFRREHIKSPSSKASLDVAVMIAEFICPIDYTMSDLRNIRKILSAFQWRPLDWFWERRLKGHTYFEVNKLRETSSPIDWQALWLDLIDLISDREWYPSSGLANRERILKLMIAIKSNFLEIR